LRVRRYAGELRTLRSRSHLSLIVGSPPTSLRSWSAKASVSFNQVSRQNLYKKPHQKKVPDFVHAKSAEKYHNLVLNPRLKLRNHLNFYSNLLKRFIYIYKCIRKIIRSCIKKWVELFLCLRCFLR
jgi:hypothetical protein